MLKVQTKNAKSGMVLALPVPNPQSPNHNLLLSDYKLTSQAIRRLRDFQINELWVRYPGLDGIDQYIDSRLLERRGKIVSDIKDAFEKVQGSASVQLPYEKYLKSIAAMVEHLLKNPATILFMEDLSSDASDWMLQHSSANSFLALVLGMRLDWYLIRQRRRLPPRYAREVSNLGLGAMLADVGLLQIEEDVMQRWRDAGDDSDPAWRAHTRIGYELVRGKVEPSAAVVVLHHHQRFDGSGFPVKRGHDGKPVALSGEQIHIFARIAAVADAFNTLHNSPAGVMVPAVRVVRQLITEPCVRWFDPMVLYAFIAVVPPYPLGEPVRLSDGRMAIPFEHHPDNPCQPSVQLIGTPEQSMEIAASISTDDPPDQSSSSIIDLRDESDLRIVESENCDVTNDYFDPPQFKGTGNLKDEIFLANTGGVKIE